MAWGTRPRVALEAAFLIAVAAAAGVVSLSMPEATIVMGGAWLLVALVEWRTSRRPPAPTARSSAALEAQGSWPPAPDPVPEPLPEPVPPVEPETPPPEPLETDPEGAPPPLPEPVTPADEPLIDLEAAPEQVREPEPAQAEVIPLVSRREEPCEWNVWDLERALRANSGADIERDEELTYLLMYLREFAGPDGLLPANFDGLVRESFGDLLGSGTR